MIDVFRKFDPDNSTTVSKPNFGEALMVCVVQFVCVCVCGVSKTLTVACAFSNSTILVLLFPGARIFADIVPVCSTVKQEPGEASV